jgi:hypothetical protein
MRQRFIKLRPLQKDGGGRTSATFLESCLVGCPCSPARRVLNTIHSGRCLKVNNFDSLQSLSAESTWFLSGADTNPAKDEPRVASQESRTRAYTGIRSQNTDWAVLKLQHFTREIEPGGGNPEVEWSRTKGAPCLLCGAWV